MILDRARLGRAVVLAAWAAFFAWLWASGEMSRYLGPRTYWVVVFGTFALGVASAAHFLTLRGNGSPRPFSRELPALLMLLLPLIAVVAVPEANLGSLAASRKSPAAPSASIVAPDPGSASRIDLRDLHYASSSEDYAARAGVFEGARVSVIGFVTTSPDTGSGYGLTRFYVSCCAADAMPYTAVVRSVSGEPRPPEDSWLRVDGVVERSGERYVVAPGRVRGVPEPRDPYLY